MSLLLLLTAASAVGLVFQRLAIPGGLIVGAMIGGAAFSLLRGGDAVAIPSSVRTATYVVLGAAIGSSVTRDTLNSLREAVLPAVLAAVLLIAAGIAIAYLLRAVGLAPPSAVLATSPGALSTMAAVAAQQGSGAAEVALFHTVRIILVLASLPGLLALLSTGDP